MVQQNILDTFIHHKFLMQTHRLENLYFASYSFKDLMCLNCGLFTDHVTPCRNFTSICPCQPRCEREEYRPWSSSALLSHLSSYQQIFNKHKQPTTTQPYIYRYILLLLVGTVTPTRRYRYIPGQRSRASLRVVHSQLPRKSSYSRKLVVKF